MKHYQNDILEAFVTLLDGNLTSDGVDYPVYSVMPATKQDFYVLLGSFTSVEDDTKDRFMANVTLDVQIVGRFDKRTYSRKEIGIIVNSLKTLVKPTTTSSLDLSPDFNNTILMVDNESTDTSLFDTDKVYRHILRYRMIIEELT